jgi:hypothetical protein
MTYTEFDIKLIRHALDTNSEGEARNAAAMFFKELRKRGIKAHEFLASVSNGNVPPPGDNGNVPPPRHHHAGPDCGPWWGYGEEPPKIDYKWMYEFEKRQLQEERGRRVAAQNALAECQKELAKLRRKESSLWSGLVRSVTG